MQDEIRVHIHRRAEEESNRCNIHPDVLGGVFADSWRRLRKTPGTKMRRLSSTPGYDFRLRIGGDTRAVASIARDTQGRLSAYVHEVDRRGEVYRRDAFEVRLKEFWRNPRGGSKQPNAEFVARNYRYINLAVPKNTEIVNEKSQFASVHVLLQPQQQDFFNHVLPLLTEERRNDAELVIGYGPPGSGKTLVACDLAVEAFYHGYEVDVLVPSLGLESEYTRILKSWHALGSGTGGDAKGVRIWRYPNFFAQIAGVKLRHDRESRLRAWWQEVLATPDLKASISQRFRSSEAVTPRDLTERMPVLVDALLEDEYFWEKDGNRVDAKDRMSMVFEAFVSFLREYRGGLLEQLESANHQDENAIVTRAGIASRSPADSLSAPGDGHGDPLRLMIVDEAQDLAPAEWRRLLDLWFPSRPDGRVRRERLVLLGDLNQRVSLVPFHWKDIKSYAIMTRKVPSDRIVESQVDVASYRMFRNIGIFASAAFDERVTGQRDMRSQGHIDYEKLAEGGSVHVAVVDRRQIGITEVLEAGRPSAMEGEYYFMIHGDTGDVANSPSRPDALLNSVRTAKGLEGDRVVVVHPFAAREARKPASLTPDEASEFYTAVSRARAQVLLVIDEGARMLLASARDAWQVAQVHDVGSDTTKLRELVENCRIELSQDEVRAELVRQLGRICEQPGEGGDDVGNKIVTILGRLADHPDEDLPFDLVEAGKLLASTDTSVFAQVRERARQEMAAGRYAGALALLLFAGETALAARYVARLPAEAVESWSPEWLQAVAGDSCWQAWRAGREVSDESPVWTPDLLESNVYKHTIDRVRVVRRNVEAGEHL